MSVPARSQEDPYAFTEASAPTPTLPANTTLFKQQQHQQQVASSSSVTTSTSVPIIQAGTSLLANNNANNSVRLNHVVGQRTLLGTTAAKLAPIKVTLVQSPTGGILGKARLNGTTITSSPQGTVFRTVTVPQATTIVQRPVAAPSSSGAATVNAATPTVFTKPLQVQISPQQAAAVAAAGGKFTARRILASKSPNVSPMTAVSGGHPSGIQTVRIVKTSPANVLQPVAAGRTAITAADGTRRFISHSGAASLLGSPVVVTTSQAAAMSTQQQPQQQSSSQQLPTISPTKIRLIQPQPQGKIFLHTPNSSNSLAAATHISNPISIAALRNSLAKQNPSLLNKIVVQQQQQLQQQQQSPQQQVQIAVSGSPSAASNGLPTVRMIPTSTAVTAINIRRAVSAAATSTSNAVGSLKRQMSLETGNTTVMVPTMAKPAPSSTGGISPVVVKQVKVIPATSSPQQVPVSRPQTIQIPQTLLQQRAKTPTQSILKPQPPRPQVQQQAATPVKTPQKFVIASPKTPQQQQQQQLNQQHQQLHPQQVMVLASPKSLGGVAGGHQQQQVMVVTAPKGLGAGGHQQHQVVVLAPFKPGQLTAVNRQPQQLLTASVMKQIQQQQQQILTSPVVKTIQKVQPQPASPVARPQIVTAPVVKQVVQNQVARPPPQQPQQQLQQVVAKTIQQRQFIATSVAKSIQQVQQQQIVVTSVAKPTPQPQQPPQVVTTSIVKPIQQPQPQVAPKPPQQQPPPQPTPPPPPQQPQLQQQFVVIPPKPVPQLAPTVTATPPPPPPPPAPTPPVSLPPADDFTIPSFIIPKQKEAKKVATPEKVVVPVKPAAPVVKPVAPVVPQPPPPPPPPAVVQQVPQAPPPAPAVVPPIIPEPQMPSTSSAATAPLTPKPKAKESGGKAVPKRAAKRSYSRSSHNETLERIDEPAVAPPMPKIHKWEPPGAVSVPVNREWHAPGSWIYDICPPGTRNYDELESAPLSMDCWFEERYASSEFDADLIRPRKMGGRKGAVEMPVDDGELVELSLEEQSMQRKALMRRRAVQYWNAQRLRDAQPARKRLKAVERVLGKLEKHRETMLRNNGGTDLPKCQRTGCERDALLATTHCRQHISDNTEQRLFQRCTAKFSDNSQCQIPVFDVRQELVLCREHAWKHDNHDKMSAEVRLLKKPTAPATAAVPNSITLKKKPPKMPLVKIVQPVTPAPANKTTKAGKKKKKLTPFQQQMALHQQQYKQQYAVKPTLPPPPYPTVQQPAKPVLYRQQQSQPKYQPPVQIVQPNRNLHIPLNQPHRPQQQQQHMIGRSEDFMLNYQGQQVQQQQQQYTHQQVQQILAAASAGGVTTVGATQDLLNICENSSAYASSEDTGVGGLSESELMAAQDVIEEIPFEIGTLNNVLSQLPPDAFNELLFSEQDGQNGGPPFESTREEEEDLERALEAVGEHVKSLEDMTVESANLFGDFLDNVDDEMLDGADICSDASQMLVVQSPGGPNDIRGLVHT